MIAKFREVTPAIAYVCEAFACLEEDDPVYLHAVVGNGYFIGSRQISRKQLREVLLMESQHFHWATVALGSLQNGQPFAGLQCSCDTQTRKSCPHHCEHSYSRPLILVLGGDTGIAERKHLLTQITHEIRDDIKDERRRDRLENLAISRHPDAERKRGECTFQKWLDNHSR